MSVGAGTFRLVKPGSDYKGGRRYPWQLCECPPLEGLFQLHTYQPDTYQNLGGGRGV